MQETPPERLSERYEPHNLEPAVQQRWREQQAFKAVDDPAREKFYCLCMFPYPSGKLHMGHVRNYTIGDVLTRHYRMRGLNVLQPMGWDAFGLPAEQHALKTGVHPALTTRRNIDTFRRQLRAFGRDEIVVSSQHRVQAYDPGSGGELWSCAGNTFEVIPTPVVGHGLVFCSSGRAGPTLAIRPGGKGDVAATHLAWKASKGSPFVPSPLLLGDLLYMVNDMASVATCYEARTGEVVWQGRLGEEQREGFSASPVAADGKLFFTNDRGETFVLKAGRRFELLRVNALNAPVLASPALVDGRFYFRTDKELVAVGR